jgi:hypothetical protein
MVHHLSTNQKPRHTPGPLMILSLASCDPLPLKRLYLPIPLGPSMNPQAPRAGVGLTSLSGFPRPSPALLRISPLFCSPRHPVDFSRVGRKSVWCPARSCTRETIAGSVLMGRLPVKRCAALTDTGVPGLMEQKTTILCMSLYWLCFYRHLSSGLSGCRTHHRW